MTEGLAVDVNPYAPPQRTAIAAGEFVDDSAAGVWRSGKYLVVRIFNPTYPRRCVKTNTVEELESVPTNVEWIPQQTIWVLMSGAIGQIIARELTGKKATLHLPVGREWREKQRQRAWYGWFTVIGGVFALSASVIASVFLMLAFGDDVGKWSIPFVLVSPLVSIGGLIYVVIVNQPLAAARKITNEHVFLDRIHPEYLNSLPDWPGKPA